MAQQDWFAGVRDVSQRAMEILPALAAAVGLLLAGLLLGRMLSWLARRSMRALVERVARTPSLSSAIQQSGVATQAPVVVGAIAFWVVFVFFVAAAMETVGLPVVTASVSRVAYYLPNVLAAVVVVFVGLIVGNVLGGVATRAAAGTGALLGRTVGGLVRGAVVLVAAVVAIEQVGIQANVLIVVVAVVVGAALAGAGLAFGLGARTAVSSIIASHYVAQAYSVGQVVRLNGIEGKIIQLTPTAVFLEVPEGRAMIPARQFAESASVLLTAKSP